MTAPVGSAAQSTITGVVVDAGSSRPVADATVSIRQLADTAITLDDGTFRIQVRRTGAVILETRHLAYAPRADTITVVEGEDAIVRIALVEGAIALPPITVETRSRRLESAGFFARRGRGMGMYFTRAQLKEQKLAHLSDVLSRVPGLRRSIQSDGNSRVESRGGQLINRRCEIQYIVDGVRSELGAAALDGIPIDSVEGVEIYRGASEVPTQFDHGTAMCGAVVVWTRGG